jgi:F0F1-type ATP synthase assembly protein I
LNHQGGFFVNWVKSKTMLGILILIGICVGFYNLAKKKGLNPILYAVLSIVFWFGFQFIAGFILGLTDPYAVDDFAMLVVWGLAGSVVGIIVLYFILLNAAKQREFKEMSVIDDVVDGSDTFED